MTIHPLIIPPTDAAAAGGGGFPPQPTILVEFHPFDAIPPILVEFHPFWWNVVEMCDLWFFGDVHGVFAAGVGNSSYICTILVIL